MTTRFQTRPAFASNRLLNPQRAGALALAAAVWSGATAQAADTGFLSADLAREKISSTDARVERAAGGVLRVRTGHEKPWPGIAIGAPDGRWDLSAKRAISIPVTNTGPGAVTVSCRVDNDGADGVKNCVTGSLKLEPGASGLLNVALHSTPWRLSGPTNLIGMRGNPEFNGKLDSSKITQMLFFVNKPAQDHAFDLGLARAEGSVLVLDATKIFPLIDTFGQFAHASWPGKIAAESDLKARASEEERDLAARPSPDGWDIYGGWKNGPQLATNMFFRVEKVGGQWWLVDPQGRLFWSHGIDCVQAGSSTPISDREHYFSDLPAADSPLSRFYGSGSWAPHGYYLNHTPYKTYDFAAANVVRKYGADSTAAYTELTHRRLRSWGMNTIANWSDRRIYSTRKTPYTATIGGAAKPLAGSEGYWGKFDDVFDPSFREGIRRSIAREKGASVGDPWCLGYFVHNEIAWGDDVSLAVATLKSPASQAAKKVFVEELTARYGQIAKLNDAWGTTHASWDALLASTDAPDTRKAGADLRAFYSRFAETYFQTIRDELRAGAPGQLYLGCRFAWVNDLAARAGAKFCDVVSYNRYEYSVADLKLPAGLDKPLIIGEFHFGALDRGMFHTGLRVTASQEDRAAKYRAYVEGALRNPALVGTHWFQFKDQATTGRPDGENYQIGFLDICDTPYPETIAASRQVGGNLYELRRQAAR